ncbi:MAG: hypothetical protein ACREGG_03065 [Candidatus Saccharimonadales bacterium]
MKTIIISTKEIRNDLEGFLKKLKSGQTIQVMYRSKPLVTVTAKSNEDAFEAPDAGAPVAIKRSIALAKRLNEERKGRPILDPDKSFRELYEETQTL